MGEEGRTRREEGKTVHDKQSYESIRRRWTNNDEEEGEDEVMLICVFRKSARTNLVGGNAVGEDPGVRDERGDLLLLFLFACIAISRTATFARRNQNNNKRTGERRAPPASYGRSRWMPANARNAKKPDRRKARETPKPCKILQCPPSRPGQTQAPARGARIIAAITQKRQVLKLAERILKRSRTHGSEIGSG